MGLMKVDPIAVAAVNPHTSEMLHARGEFDDETTKPEDAAEIALGLLEAFLKPNGGILTVPGFGVAAPYSWATQDSKVAAAVSAVLQEHGVTGSLSTVGVASKEDVEFQEKAWFMQNLGLDCLMEGWGLSRELSLSWAFKKPEDSRAEKDGPSCDGCGIEQAATKKLKTCATCGQAKYCSRDCQKLHWPEHKPFCHAEPDMDARTYHYTMARKSPEARLLAKSINLELLRECPSEEDDIQ